MIFSKLYFLAEMYCLSGKEFKTLLLYEVCCSPLMVFREAGLVLLTSQSNSVFLRFNSVKSVKTQEHCNPVKEEIAKLRPGWATTAVPKNAIYISLCLNLRIYVTIFCLGKSCLSPWLGAIYLEIQILHFS